MTARWPLEPLLEATGLSMGGLSIAVNGNPYDYRDLGLSDLVADRWAVRCGKHPGEVWPGWFDAGLTELDREFVGNGWRQAWLWNETHTATVTRLPVVELEDEERAA
jgi:hypothetical protein